MVLTGMKTTRNQRIAEHAHNLIPLASQHKLLIYPTIVTALGLHPTMHSSTEVAAALKMLGYRRRRVPGTRRSSWVRPEGDLPELPDPSQVVVARDEAGQMLTWEVSAEGAVPVGTEVEPPDPAQVVACVKWLRKFAARGSGRPWRDSPNSAITFAREVSDWVRRTRHHVADVGPSPDISPGAALKAALLENRKITVSRDGTSINRDAHIDIRAHRARVMSYRSIPVPGDPARDDPKKWWKVKSMVSHMATLPSWMARLDEVAIERLGVEIEGREIEKPWTDGEVETAPLRPESCDDTWYCYEHFPDACPCIDPGNPVWRDMPEASRPVLPMNTPEPGKYGSVATGGSLHRRPRVALHMRGMHHRVRDERAALLARGEAVPETNIIVAKLLKRDGVYDPGYAKYLNAPSAPAPMVTPPTPPPPVSASAPAPSDDLAAQIAVMRAEKAAEYAREDAAEQGLVKEAIFTSSTPPGGMMLFESTPPNEEWDDTPTPCTCAKILCDCGARS